MSSLDRRRVADFGAFVKAAGGLVVQPRMGFGSPERMRAGLAATKSADARTVGTITLDSYTRVGDHEAVVDALRQGVGLNGYPIVHYDRAVTERVLDGIGGPDFPVQVRHGSAQPRDIFAALVASGMSATEGGPVSYCLPYGRTRLADSVAEWAACVESFARLREVGVEPHLETFGGCMMGQLCPPSELVAISVLEALFFHAHGVRSVSVSYAQQTNHDQDVEAVLALRRLCAELLPHPDWHVVVYAYMGLYPVTPEGAYRLLGKAAELAVATGSERLIVKTVAESRRIPTVEENVSALEHAARVAERSRPLSGPADSATYQEARTLIEAVLNLHPDIGTALRTAFARGYLDVPYCLHPDNAGRTRGYIDDRGWLRWADTGRLPLGRAVSSPRTVTAGGLLADLSHVRRAYDAPHAQVEPVAGV
ncbi:methylaspartate mutase [Saccharothrix deserti]|uniref:methylaspartate mutase n=1 Tax=Saccharothrix deserti TaxID=2593674 RepID=UPI002368A097|nr:methylaspartate mutase [Saccharothrix deserti]